MKPATILQNENCEVPRTPEELIAWIESLDAANDYAGVDERLIKAFYEEIRPAGASGPPQISWTA